MKDIFKLGMKGSIPPEEIYKPKLELESKNITSKFVELWAEELNKKHPKVLRVILKIYGFPLILFGILFSIVETTMRYVQILYAKSKKISNITMTCYWLKIERES